MTDTLDQTRSAARGTATVTFQGRATIPRTAAPELPATAGARLIISVLSLLTLAVGLIGVASGAGVLRTVGLTGWMMFGVGAAPWALRSRMRLSTRVAMSVLTSLVMLVLGSLAMLEWGRWHPLLLAAVLGVLAAPAHVAGAITAAREALPMPRPGAVPPALLLSVSGAVIALVAALTHRHVDPGLWGFLVHIGPLWYVGLALILASLLISRNRGEATMAAGALLMMLVLTGTPALVYDGPRSQSAAKHIEFVTQIRTFHEMRSTVALYNSWPGYFSAMAWLCDVTGIKDPFGLSTVWPVLVGLCRIAAMRFLAGQVLRTPARAWAAVLIGVLADPIGADYFSPQSLGFVVGLIAFGLALSPIKTWHKAAAMTAAGAAIAVSHQLSPYLIGGALCVLVIFRQVRPWWLPATILGPAVVWALLHLGDLRSFLSLGEVGNASNFKPPATTATTGLERLPIVGLTVSALVAGVALVGLVALYVLARQRKDRRSWALAVCPAIGLGIVAVNPYGNEGIFRTMLFGLPWLSLLAAQAVWPGKRRLAAANLPLAGLCVALTVTFCVAAFGLDSTNVLRTADRQAYQVFQNSEPGLASTSYLLELGPGDLPSSPPSQQAQHVAIKRSDLDTTDSSLSAGTPQQQVSRITQQYRTYAGDSPMYAIWSPVSEYYGWEYGLHTREQFERLRAAFEASPSWTTVFTRDGAVLFQYVPQVTAS